MEQMNEPVAQEMSTIKMYRHFQIIRNDNTEEILMFGPNKEYFMHNFNLN